MHSRAWRTYDCLFYRYVQQFTQQEVADQIGISTRQLQREQQAALERLADQLWERIDLDADNDQMIAADGMLSDATVAVVSDELDWLRDISAKGHAEPAQLLSAAVNLVEPLAENHGVRIYLEVDTALPALAANAVALNQTLLNLLTIAIHRAECCERCVHISAHATRWGTRIEISCDGGRRTPAADDKSSLGMAFQLAELGGAELSVDETGDRFHSTLTLQAIEQMPVVVIDDNEDTLNLMQRYASGTPFRVVGASTPGQIFMLVEEHNPEIIVLDVMMPEVSGWNVLNELRRHPATKHIPVIMCTILPQEELARSLGASGYIRKPVTREAFLDALNRTVARMAPESH